MSLWTHINGTITVSPIGRTQPEKRYILDTVLEHLPLVTGSERDMDVYVIQKNDYNGSCSCDEFGDRTNNLTNMYGRKSRRNGWMKTQDDYIIVVDGDLRDRVVKETFREFQKWLCRLSKRVIVEEVLVKIGDGYDKEVLIRDERGAYYNMFEVPSWNNEDGSVNWCEYLLWERAKGLEYPLLLAYKYYRDDENDAEAERRLKYWQEE